MSAQGAPTFRTILAALDESARAASVFATAVSLARCAGSRVVLLRVLAEPPAIPPAGHTHIDHLDQDMRELGQRELQRFMADASDVPFEPAVIVDGDPWRRILEIAAQVNADLIVLGGHRHHGVERVLGTVASRVVNHADRHVLVVHHDSPSVSAHR